MGQILSLLPTQPPVDAAWDRYAALSRAVRGNPMLIEDPHHTALRREAYRRFVSAFNGDISK